MDISLADLVGPNLSIYESLHNELNKFNTELIPSQQAAAFLKRSNLPINVLVQIWDAADYKKLGKLDKQGCFIAFKLVAACQQGFPPNSTSLLLNINPPVFASRSATPSLPNFGGLSSPLNDIWTIDQTDQQKYDSIFDGLKPISGKISGDKVRPVLLKSGLPSSSLAKIWELADIDKDGMLDRTELSIALHLVYCALKGENIPLTLPSSLAHPSKMQHRKFSTGILPPSKSALSKRNRTHSVTSTDNIYLSSQLFDTNRSQSVQPGNASSPVFQQQAASTAVNNSWQIQTVTYEAQFRQADTNDDGFVSGSDVRELLLSSSLPQSTLAHLWALVDFRKTGMLNIEQFALIMHLIDKCKEGMAVPFILPMNLIPPSFRTNNETILSKGLNEKTSGKSNRELEVLQEEVQKLILDRREAEQAIVQLEADMTVKNSELKNLHIELNTLESTVSQLERQKSEAERRLNAIDTQIVQLERTGTQLKEKFCDEESRYQLLVNENARNKENSAKEIAELEKLRTEIEELERKKANLSLTISQRNIFIENSANHLSNMERDVSSLEEKIKSLSTESMKLTTLKTRLTESIAKADIKSLVEEFNLLRTSEISSEVRSLMTGTADQIWNTASKSGPDPFDNDSFSSQAICEASTGSGISGQSRNAGLTDIVKFTDTTIKTPPPRPAPPKSRATPANMENDPFTSTDPFASSISATSQFADFADFDAFSS